MRLTYFEVSELIDRIPQALTPNEFLVELANEAAKLERQANLEICARFPDHVATVIAETIQSRNQK